MAGKPVVSVSDIWESRNRIGGQVHTTPMVLSATLSSMRKASVYVKLENLQKTGSFKVRGAFNSILMLSSQKRPNGIIAFSSGNHAQAVAFAARSSGIPATVVMPVWVNRVKLEATRSYGAKVVLHGNNSTEMAQKAEEIKEVESLELVHPFDSPGTIAGQGTIGLEILDAVPDVDCVYVAIGGGGLIAGISVAIKSLSPKTKIIGVQPEGSCSMLVSRQLGKVTEIDLCRTIADGLVAKRPGENTFAIVSRLVDDIITVPDEDIKKWMVFTLQRMKMLVEPSGVTSLAGLMSGKGPIGSKNVAVFSGGNCDLSLLGETLQEEYAKATLEESIMVGPTDKRG